MSPSDGKPAQTATQKLAALVAQRKATAGGGKNIPGQRQSERSAAARSASRSQPALRK